MCENYIKYALENFIDKNYFEDEKNCYLLEEVEENGRSQLKLKVTGRNLCVSEFDNKRKCAFVRDSGKTGIKKSVDHLVFKNTQNVWELHLIEMKSSISMTEKWYEIKQKFRASYLNAKALAAFLNINIDVERVYLYTTYEKECFSSATTSNPRLIAQPLGSKLPDPKKEWETGVVSLNFGEFHTFRHNKIRIWQSLKKCQ